MDRFIELLQQRINESIAAGLWDGHARSMGLLETRIAEWPAEWGDDFVVLIFGDFDAPKAELHVPHLGITIEPEVVLNSFIRQALCVLRARVKIKARTVEALVDAAGRINTLLGILAAVNWGNSAIGWWSHLTHDSTGGGLMKWDLESVQKALDGLESLAWPVAQKVRSSLYWIREPHRSVLERHRSDVLAVYAGYWNAFECLVEAVCLLRPQPKRSRSDKQSEIMSFFAERDGKLDASTISECYKAIVDPGFVEKASHALQVCFPEQASRYILECFKMLPQEDRLYNIRNAINHGDVNPDDIGELLRVEDRLFRLRMIVFRMLGQLLPIDTPSDELGAKGSPPREAT